MTAKTKHISFFIIFVLLIFTACKKIELDKIATEAWNPSFAIPAAIGEFGVYDILARQDSSNLVQIDAQGAIAIVYKENAELVSASDLIAIPDQSFNFSESIVTLGVPPLPIFSGSQSVNVSESMALNNALGGELYSIDFKSGNLVIAVSTTLMHSVRYDFTFPDLLDGGVPVTETIDLAYAGSVPHSGSATINLNNSILDLTTGSNGFNELRVQAVVTITGSGSPILGNESIAFDLNMNQLDFDLVTGNLGAIALPNFQDTIALKIFNNNSQGNFQLANPSIEFTFSNSFGMPVEMQFNSIKTKEINSGTEFPLQGFPPSFLLSAPTTPGQTAVSTFTITDQNSANIQNIISPTPKVLIYDLGGDINPSGPVTNFVKDDSKISVEGTINLPLEGFATGFLFKDTLKANLNLDNEFIESALIRLNIENGFPLGAKVRVLLVDMNYLVLKDLTNGFKDLIVPAPVNSSGRATTKAQSINDFTITKSELVTVKNTEYIIFEIDAETYQGSQSTTVKFYDDYKLKLRLGMQIQGSVNP